MMDHEKREQTYKWTIDINEFPFEWKCGVCGTITTILSNDIGKKHECSNDRCPYTLTISVIE